MFFAETVKENNLADPYKKTASRRNRLPSNLDTLLETVENSDTEVDKMRILTSKDTNLNTLGHLCLTSVSLLGMSSYSNKYANIIKKLEPKNLFTIMKYENSAKVSIWTMYQKYRPDSESLFKCLSQDPSVFCEAIQHFELNAKMLQKIANTIGVKSRIRNHLLGLPDTEDNWNLLGECINNSTSIGKFCAKKSNFFGEPEDQAKTVMLIRQKLIQSLGTTTQTKIATAQENVISQEINPGFEQTIPLAYAYYAPSAPPMEVNYDFEPTALHFTKSVKNQANPKASIFESQKNERYVPSKRTSLDFWFYTSVSLVLLGSIYAAWHANTQSSRPNL